MRRPARGVKMPVERRVAGLGGGKRMSLGHIDRSSQNVPIGGERPEWGRKRSSVRDQRLTDEASLPQIKSTRATHLLRTFGREKYEAHLPLDSQL